MAGVIMGLLLFSWCDRMADRESTFRARDMAEAMADVGVGDD